MDDRYEAKRKILGDITKYARKGLAASLRPKPAAEPKPAPKAEPEAEPSQDEIASLFVGE